jgi:hypothetical protein
MPHSPQQNGRAERFNHTIMEKASAMLHHAGMSQGFWETAVATACHLYNRTPTRSNKWRTPLELWNGTIPNVSYYRVYGCKAYYHVPDHNRHKLDPKSREAVFVGYEPHSKGYTLWDSRSRSLVSSRDVTFDEKTFPSRPAVGKQAPSIPNSSLSIPNSNDTLGIPFVFDAAPGTPPLPPPAPARVVPPVPQYQRGAPGPQAPQDNPDDDSEPHTPPKKTELVPDQTVYQTPPSQPPATSPPAHCQNVRRWQQHCPNNINSVPLPVFSPPPLERNTNRDSPVELPAMPSPPRRTTRAHRPNPHFYNEDNTEFVQGSSRLGVAQLLAAAEIPGYREPFTYKEAMGSNQADEWTEACQYEIDTLHKLKVWNLVDLPQGCKTVKCKWVFKWKADGHYCARLVAKGFTQLEGVDFDETFSPVAHFESLRLVLALATLEDREIHQMDVKSAFLHGDLDEEIYMEQPIGFVVAGQEHKVCKLQKALYGLKQASHAWNLQFHGVLNELSFTQTYSDAGVYVYHLQEGGDSVIVILYVDDITILGNSIKKINALKKSLSSRYEMTDLGEIQSYLGVNIIRDRANRTMDIDQKEYVQTIVERFGMRDANPVYTPLPAGCEDHLVKFDGQASSSEIKNYQRLIGSLLYVQIGTRPDISFAVGRLSQYSSNPSPHHERLARYVLAYLNATKDKALHYAGGTSRDELHGFADSSWGDQEDRHSTSGSVFILANAAISWSSRKQKTIAQSTTEAEYMSVCEASNQAAWYKTFLEELGYEVSSPIPLHCDNKGAVDLALNPVTGRRSKHIAIKHHAIREYVKAKVIDLVRTPTGEMLADGLTKSLPRASFDLMVNGLGFANERKLRKAI